MPRRFIYNNHIPSVSKTLVNSGLTYNGVNGSGKSFTWTVPEDLVSMQFECYGSGGFSIMNSGGGGGAYAKTTSVLLYKNNVVTISIPSNYAGQPVVQCYSGSTIYCKAQGGDNEGNLTPGTAANSVGDVKYSGSARSGQVGGNAGNYGSGGGAGGAYGSAGGVPGGGAGGSIGGGGLVGGVGKVILTFSYYI